jgi:hypothetical protein
MQGKVLEFSVVNALEEIKQKEVKEIYLEGFENKFVKLGL